MADSDQDIADSDEGTGSTGYRDVLDQAQAAKISKIQFCFQDC